MEENTKKIIQSLLRGDFLNQIETMSDKIDHLHQEIDKTTKSIEKATKKGLDDIEEKGRKIKESIKSLNSKSSAVVKEALRQIIDSELKDYPEVEKIIINESPKHFYFPLLLLVIKAKIPVWLFGDAGSGKSTAVASAAKLLGLRFGFISVCPTTTKSEFFGYKDASGVYHKTVFRDIYEHGGVFLIDEIDNGNPSILSVLNSALANGSCAFPDGNIKKHDSVVICGTANTIGRGANVRYVGRNRLDATTLDRFVFIRFDIDEELESAICGLKYNKKQVDIESGGAIKKEEWVKRVQKVRAICNDLNIEQLITPRASIYGSLLAGMGVGIDHIDDLCLWKGLNLADVEKIKKNIKR